MLKETALSLLLAGGLVMPAMAADTGAWLQSWEVRAVRLQNHIDQRVSMNRAVYPATHNSFNSAAYANWSGRYAFPNHVLSIRDQLDAGIRAIEMDAHWSFHSSWSAMRMDLKLCHGTDSHLGCHPNDRLLEEGLSELADWLRANPEEVVLLYIEDKMSGHQDKAISLLNRLLGDRLYTPRLHAPAARAANQCVGLPHELSKAQVRAAGKNVLVMGADRGSCEYDWANYSFHQHFHITVDHKRLNAYPNCQVGNGGGMAGPDLLQTNLVRAYNDAASSLNDSMSAQTVADLVKCGVGAVAPEPLKPGSDHFKAQVWSWDVNQPDNSRANDPGGEHCAEQMSNGRLNDLACKAFQRRFACQATQPVNGWDYDWRITRAAGVWQDGQAACQAEFGAQGYAFAMPANGYENARLRDAANAAGAGGVWVNYADLEAEGKWMAYRPVYAVWQSAQTDRGCARLDADGYRSSACDQRKRFACQEFGTGNWRLSRSAEIFGKGDEVCRNEFGWRYALSAPANHQQFEALLADPQARDVWVNLRHPGSVGVMLPAER
ncbi:phosphatidylinositol-specific phospholipase C domain-containing protein [Parachitinimonas caeni]|uniref:C-type lectin domain-containing protein n=1 Tax=Parachitinimonas caeni TaxID=3031301 RepID=A0ABT7E131_9NEIS|nr:phosphatidylinositol-specific phospholipase C domain-containing protein [Parachitinimonas caeni]MDK2126035.1 hypothetical protein [Parachitinimonas caeni]